MSPIEYYHQPMFFLISINGRTVIAQVHSHTVMAHNGGQRGWIRMMMVGPGLYQDDDGGHRGGSG